jgi:hypothetical protein
MQKLYQHRKVKIFDEMYIDMMMAAGMRCHLAKHFQFFFLTFMT